MNILFYDTKSYDRNSFDRILHELVNSSDLSKSQRFSELKIDYIKADLDTRTAPLSKGFDAVCAFVSSDINGEAIAILARNGVKLILLRCAGFNNVNLEKAKESGIKVMRVPGYSPEAVAEHAMAMALACNRRIYKAYNKVRENDFSLNGLMGKNFYKKKAGIIGTGKIGAAMARICHGFGMEIMAYDVYENEDLKSFVTYVPLEKLLNDSDLISLHCPLTDSTYHLICLDTIRKMKDGVILVNTSRGALVKTEDLIEGIRMHKFDGVGLDVYEEESKNVFENRSEQILESSITARLLSFPNVLITSHQGFFTEEALTAIAEATLQNAVDFLENKESNNYV